MPQHWGIASRNVGTTCTRIAHRAAVHQASRSFAVTPTQAMINNGGFVLLMTRHNTTVSATAAGWIPLVAPAITVTPTTALSLTEGGSTGTYNVKLAAPPTGNVKVRVASNSAAVTVKVGSGAAGSSADIDFTTANWDTAQAVTVAAAEDGNFVSETVTLTYSTVNASTSSEYDTVANVTRTVNVTDDDRGIVVSRSGTLALTEGGSAGMYNVKLTTAPAGNVVVRVSSSDGGAVSVNKSGGTAGSSQDLTFTISNWDTDQAITLSAVEDGNAANESVTITHSVVTASSSSDYGSVSDVTFTATVADDERVDLVVSETSLTVTEASGAGRAGTFTVKLGSEPSADVTVAVSSGDATEGTVSPSSLTFTTQNWATARTVTVTAVDDAVDDGDQTYNITLDPSSSGDSDYNGLSSRTVSVTTTDDDTKDVTISRSSATINESGAGNSFTYTVKLASQPTAQVTVTVTAPSGVATVNPTSLTFDADDTNSKIWSRAQTVTVTAVDDEVDNAADRTGSVTHSVSGGGYGTGVTPGQVSVTLTDDDDAGVTVSKSRVSLTEGGSGDYTVVLDAKPSASVTVTVTSDDGAKVKVKKGTDTKANSITLTFNPTGTDIWSTAQTVTVVAEEDNDSLNESVTLRHSLSGSAAEYPSSLSVSSVTVDVTDDDAPNLIVSPTALALTEGGSAGTYNVRLTAAPASDVVVEVSSDNGDVTVSKDGGTTKSSSVRLTFTPSGTGIWSTNQVVTVEAGEDTDLLDESATITHSVVAADSADEYDNIDVDPHNVDVTVTDDDYAGLSIADASVSESGGTLAFTVTKNMASSRAVTVDWTLAAGTATEGTDYDATTTTGTLTFSSGGSLTQTVSVPVTDDFDVEGDETVTVTLGNQSPADVTISDGSATGTIVDDDVAGARVTPERSLRSTTEDNAGTVELGVALSSKPSADVTVTVTSEDTTEGTVKAAEDDPDPTLTFTSTNWNTAQTVTVTGVDDEDLDGDVEYNIRLAFSTAAATATPPGDADYRGLGPVDVPFTNLDDDLSILSVSGGGEVTEGDSGSSAQAEFTVTLAPARRQEVSVSYATADGTAEAGSDYVSASGTVTFSPGETTKTVAVTVTGDDEAEANETFTLSLTETPNGQIDPQNSSAQAVIANDDEKMVDASMSGEFSVGDTTVTVDSTLPADTGLEIVLPSELESGGSMIEELTVTLEPTDQEIDADLFGYTGTDDDHVLVDIDVSPVPDSAVKVCLPITEGLRRAAGQQRLYIIRFSNGSWEELSSSTEGEMVCADVRGFSPFALVYQIDYVKRRFGEVNRAILPELSRAMTASTLEAITGRIDDAMAGGGSASSLNVSASGGEEPRLVEPGLRLGELEDGETLSLLDSVDGSYFSVSLAGGYDPPGGGSYASAAGEDVSGEVPGSRRGGLGVWMSGDYRNLSGNSGSVVDWDGRLVSGHLGADYLFGRSLLVGVATSWSQGSFDYTGRGEGTRVSGEYGSRMNSFHPYAGLSVSRRLDVWVSGGWGFGEIRMDDAEVAGRQSAATRLGNLAAGASLRLLGGGASALSLKGEAWIARMRVKDDGGRIEGLRVGTNRLRAALEGSHAISVGSGSSLVPSLEFGIRRDGGDGETGVGGELGGGVAYASSFGLVVEARGRGLLFHQGDAEEWGVGGSVRFDPGGDGRGLSMSVLPSYGNGSSGVQTLWDSERASELGASNSEREFGLETEVAYGFAALGDGGLLTPYGALGRAGGDGRNYRAGSRLSMGGTFDVSLEARRAETGGGEPEHGLSLQGRLNW